LKTVETKTVGLSSYSVEARKKILDIISKSDASHIASSFSAVEILQAVYRCVDIDKIKNHAPDRDRVVLSKGHAAAALYTTLFKFGLMTEKVLDTYNTNDSLLSGHVSHFIPGVEHSTGALGHGLPVALGMAIGLRSRQMKAKTFVIVGDGELHEGSNWEAIMMAGHLKIGNFFVLVDNNHFMQMHGRTDQCCTLHPLKLKFESFNFKTYEVDGHDDQEIERIIKENTNGKMPVAIICSTIKGRGVSFMEENNIWHYRTPKGEDYQKAAMELGGKGI
jgi:transketolase